MASRRLPRVVLSIAAAGVLVLTTVSLALMANPVAAGTAGALVPVEIPLQDDHEDTTAEDFDTHKCTDAPFANIQDNQDGWHFVVGSQAEFVQLRLTFDTGSGTVLVTVPGSNVGQGWSGILTESGGKFMHAWVITPAGWTLVTGEADVTFSGTKGPEHFQLSHTCPGTTTTTTTTTKPPTTTTTTTTSTTTTTTTTTGTETTTTETTGTTTTPDDDGDLPVTGAGLGGLIAAGLILTAGGVALILARRRRDAETDATDGTAIG
jgi:LPXTG-motif cell wall-anchored protein